jgi:hypothetical protein
MHDIRLQAIQLEPPLTTVFINCCSNSLNFLSMKEYILEIAEELRHETIE